MVNKHRNPGTEIRKNLTSLHLPSISAYYDAARGKAGKNRSLFRKDYPVRTASMAYIQKIPKTYTARCIQKSVHQRLHGLWAFYFRRCKDIS